MDFTSKDQHFMTNNFVLGPKRFLHSKGPKNVICLWLRLGIIKQSQICNLYSRMTQELDMTAPAKIFKFETRRDIKKS